MTPETARRNALIEAGGSMEQIKEEVREVWLGQAIATTAQDIRYACRSLLRSPGFAVVVVATLSLGIGTNLTMLSLMRAVLWRVLPYPEPDRIVTVQVAARNVPYAGATEAELYGLRERSRTLEQASLIYAVDANLEYAGEMEHVAAASVSNDFLPLLGARPVLGRWLDSGVDEGGGQVVAILISDELWRRRFSADPGVVGKGVRVNNLEVRIAGVLPPGFRLFLPPAVDASEQVDVWFPKGIDSSSPYRGVSIVARLRPGITLAQANTELPTLVARFARAHPEAYPAGSNVRFSARLLHDEITRDARPALFLLSGAVGFVLLIACVNVANLMVARGSARQRELEIRRALGAAKVRIIRQLITESLVLAAPAALIGLVCARLGLALIGHFSASHIPLESRIAIDGPLALAAILLSLLAGTFFGLLPAWRLAADKAGHPLRAGRTETAASGARSMQRLLVIAEVALSIVPLVCAGLMLRSFLNLTHVPLGFDPINVVTATVPFNFKAYRETEKRWALLQDILNRVRAIPGVASASAAFPLPLAPDQETRHVGRTDQLDALPIPATQQVTIPGYLSVSGTRLREGRDFSTADIASQRNVTIIDESLARRLWPEGDVIGKSLSVYRTGRRDDLEVIGVTNSVRATAVRDDNVGHFMIPYYQYPVVMSLLIKTRLSAESIAAQIQAAVTAAHTGRAAFDIRPMSAYVDDSIGDTRFLLFVLAAFAMSSILLAGIGLYGTLAYLTAQRTREFGIRLALGSNLLGIVGIVVRESVLLSATGVTLGLIGVAAVATAIRDLLYGVQPLDVMTFSTVFVLVAVVSLAAAIVPAWRAARIDPQTSLRCE